MKNFNILGVHRKIQFLGGGVTKNQYIGRDCLKKGTWKVFRFKGEAWQEREGGVFEGGLIPHCTLWRGVLKFAMFADSMVFKQ